MVLRLTHCVRALSCQAEEDLPARSSGRCRWWRSSSCSAGKSLGGSCTERSRDDWMTTDLSQLVASDQPQPQATLEEGTVLRFPPRFLWGSATSEDGRGPSIWDTFSHTTGRVHNNDNGDRAADHYHRYREDVQLMAELGLRLPILGRLAARAAARARAGQPARTGLLPASGRPPPGGRHRAVAHPVSLGPAAGARGRRGVGGAGHRRAVRRLRAARLWGAARPRALLDDPQRAVLRGLRRLRSGRHAPGRRDGAAAIRAAHHLLLGHGLAMEAMR